MLMKGEVMREKGCVLDGAAVARKSSPKPTYLPPEIVTYDKDEIIELIGPALACESNHTCATSFV